MDSRNQSAQNENILTHPEPLECTAGNKSTETKNSSIVTDEEIEKCEEWEMEELEPTVWTEKDDIILERERREKRIKEVVDMVMSASRQWTNCHILSTIHQIWGNGTSEEEFDDHREPIPENLFGEFVLEDESDH